MDQNAQSVFEVLGHRICFKISREAYMGSRILWSILWKMNLHTDLLHSVWNGFYNFIVFEFNFSHRMVKSNLLRFECFVLPFRTRSWAG